MNSNKAIKEEMCWTCNKKPATKSEYRDALGENEMTCADCHREEYPEQYEEEEDVDSEGFDIIWCADCGEVRVYDKHSCEKCENEEEEEDYKNYGVLAIGHKDEQEDIGFFYTIEEAIVEYKKVSLIDYMRVVIFESENYNPDEDNVGTVPIVKSRTKKVKKQIKLKVKK